MTAAETIRVIEAADGLRNPAVSLIQKTFHDNEQIIQRLFRRAVELGERLKSSRDRLVLTHGDVHFGNVLESENGHLYPIDWDSMMISLPEYDLMYLTMSSWRKSRKATMETCRPAEHRSTTTERFLFCGLCGSVHEKH